MQRGWKTGIAGAAAVVVMGVTWWLGSPLILDRTVNEAPPAMSDVPMDEMGMMEFMGTFRDGDATHHVKGKATVTAAGGMQYLRFEEFEATNGPDLYVYLIKPGMPVKEGLQLGPLKGNKGSQNYEIPAGTDLSMYNQVVIWCRAFNVTFGQADLSKSM